jgi:hypothetical protein
MYIVVVEIADSARKHGIPDEDILHAVRNPVAVIRVQEDRILFAGAIAGGNLLEIVVLDPDSDEPVVIHADILQPKFYRYL